MALAAAGCAAATRYRTLSIFFDGVPEPPEPATEAATGTGPEGEAAVVAATGSVLYLHEPYATKQCDACHDPRGASQLVAPRDQLCQTCHDLALDKRYVHGPLAAGGCLSCHHPHNSQYRFLLLSEAEGFCLSCHQRSDLRAIAEHEAGGESCTSCHDAHMSDHRYLLR